jgi:hypothetical protein
VLPQVRDIRPKFPQDYRDPRLHQQVPAEDDQGDDGEEGLDGDGGDDAAGRQPGQAKPVAGLRISVPRDIGKDAARMLESARRTSRICGEAGIPRARRGCFPARARARPVADGMTRGCGPAAGGRAAPAHRVTERG